MSAKLPFTIGEKKGVFTIISAGPSIAGHSVVCRCECGKERIMKVNFFYSNLNQFPRCKCYYNQTSELQKHPLYGTWKSMRCRCNWPKNDRYKNYGGRGIKVCKRWDNFLLFYEDTIKFWKPGLQMDRIDNDGDYCPENIQFIPPAENARKRPSSKINQEIADFIRVSDKKTREICTQFNISKDIVWAVRRGDTWAV